MMTTRTAHATLTAKDWKIVGFGLSGILLEDYVSTEGVEDDFEITVQLDLEQFAWEEIDRKIGEAADLGIIELIDYDQDDLI